MSKFIELTVDGFGKRFFHIDHIHAVGGQCVYTAAGRIGVNELEPEIMAKIREVEGYEVKGELLQTGAINTVEGLIYALAVNDNGIRDEIKEVLK